MPFWTLVLGLQYASTSRTLRQARYDDLFAMVGGTPVQPMIEPECGQRDKMEEVSTQWLKDVRTYVMTRQSRCSVVSNRLANRIAPVLLKSEMQSKRICRYGISAFQVNWLFQPIIFQTTLPVSSCEQRSSENYPISCNT